MSDSLRNTLDVHPAVRVEIHYDNDASDPRREFDHIATFALSHGRYDVPDEDDLTDTLLEQDGIAGAAEYLKREKHAVAVQVVYGYDHGGLTIKAGQPFSCPWDSGILGFVFVTREAMAEGWGSDWTEEDALNVIKGEVEEYDQYLTGAVYGYVVLDALTEDDLDSCWGFYGEESVEDAAKENAAYHAETLVHLAEIQAHALNDALDVPDVATALKATLVTS